MTSATHPPHASALSRPGTRALTWRPACSFVLEEADRRVVLGGGGWNASIGSYFDVTLSAVGTTSLETTVTIDRLRVSGAAGLSITSAGSLSSLIDVTQTGGVVIANGRLSSAGDYALIAGLLQGTRAVQAPGPQV